MRNLRRLNTLLTSAKILKTLQRQSLGHANKTFVRKISKRLAEFDEVFKFEKFLIHISVSKI